MGDPYITQNMYGTNPTKVSPFSAAGHDFTMSDAISKGKIADPRNVKPAPMKMPVRSPLNFGDYLKNNFKQLSTSTYNGPLTGYAPQDAGFFDQWNKFYEGVNPGESLHSQGEKMFRDALTAAKIDPGQFLYGFAEQPWGSGFSGLLDQIFTGAQGQPNFNASTALANLGDTIAYMVGDYQTQANAPAQQQDLITQLMTMFGGGGSTGGETAPSLTFPDLASILSGMYGGGGSIWG